MSIDDAIKNDLLTALSGVSSKDINDFLGYNLVDYQGTKKVEHLEAIIHKSIDNYCKKNNITFEQLKNGTK